MNEAPRSPLFNDNRIKLGVMAFNCSHGSTVTTADGAWPMTWEDNRALARMADAAGFEALLPVGRWKGYGGETNFNNRTFESLTWAAGIAPRPPRQIVLDRPRAAGPTSQREDPNVVERRSSFGPTFRAGGVQNELRCSRRKCAPIRPLRLFVREWSLW